MCSCPYSDENRKNERHNRTFRVKTVYSLPMLMQAHALRALVNTLWKPGEHPVHVGSRS